MVEKEKPKQLTKLEEARKLLIEENRKKIISCQKEISDVLKKYGMTLQVTPSQIFISPQNEKV